LENFRFVATMSLHNVVRVDLLAWTLGTSFFRVLTWILANGHTVTTTKFFIA
jgi:hypothetical protein